MAEEMKPQEAQQPAPEVGEESDVAQVLAMVRRHGQPVVIGLGLALAAFLGYGAYRNYRQSVALRASQMLMGARSPEELQQVVNQYPATPSAPIALLSLASAYFDAGQYDLAQFTYAQFEEKFPEHAMGPAAELGKAQCLEAGGQYALAMDAFEAFVKQHPDYFLTPMASLGRARCLTELGRYDEAKAAYEDFIAADPDGRWASLAETSLLFVDKEMRAREKGMETEAPVAVPALGGAAEPVTPWAAPEAWEPKGPGEEGSER